MTADALPSAPLDLEAVVPWLQMCGACDAGLPTSCTCPTGDPRPVMLALHNEVERLQERIDKAREYVADPGNWSGMDGRQRHILALLDGAALSPDTTEALDPDGWTDTDRARFVDAARAALGPEPSADTKTAAAVDERDQASAKGQQGRGPTGSCRAEAEPPFADAPQYPTAAAQDSSDEKGEAR